MANVFFVVSLNKMWKKQSSCVWFEVPHHSCDVIVMIPAIFSPLPPRANLIPLFPTHSQCVKLSCYKSGDILFKSCDGSSAMQSNNCCRLQKQEESESNCVGLGYAVFSCKWKQHSTAMWICFRINLFHSTIYITVTSQWARWHLKSPASRLFIQAFIQAQIKESIKVLHHWPLWGEFTGDRWIPRTNGQ